MTMARVQSKPPADCPNGVGHEVEVLYDVGNDSFFVACMVCGLEGPRKPDEKQAKIAWAKGQGLTEKELEINHET